MPASRGWPPRWVTTSRRRKTRGNEVADFVDSYCRATKDTIAARTGDRIRLRDWQRRLLRGIYLERPDGSMQHRTAVVGMPRKNGKSALGASLGLHGLYLGPDGGEVYSVAGDREQARICFGMARRMVELDPELSDLTNVYRDALELPSSGAVYRVLSSDAPLKEGLSPTFVVFDELHVQPDDDLWSVMSLGSGAREEALVLAITTAGELRDSSGSPKLWKRLYDYGVAVARGEVDDDRFYFAWWEPKAGIDADWRAPATWREANPGFDDIVAGEDFEASLPPKVPEHEYRTKRTNVPVAAATTHWLESHPAAWSECASDLELAGADRTAMAWDMSLRHDSTAVSTVGRVGDRVVGRTRIFTAPAGGKIDFDAVVTHVRDEAVAHDPVGIAYDPRYLELLAQQLDDEGLPMVEFPQTPERMAPACGHLFDLIIAGRYAHDDDPAVNEHVLTAVRREQGDRGWTLSKGRSKRPIDGCITQVMAAWELETAPEPTPRHAGYISLAEV